MGDEDPNDIKATPRWSRMPGSLRLRLDRAIGEHLREHGARHYDLLRDDPLYSAWIGSHLGARGEKRLDRYISEVKGREAKRSRTRVTAESRCECLAAHSCSEAAATLQTMSQAAAPALSYEELQRAARRDLALLERALSACIGPNGEILAPNHFFKLRRERRDTLRLSADLARRFSADVSAPIVMERVIERALHEGSGDPERARAMLEDINCILRDAGGLAATEEQQ
jgi:hypothetical protein